jgi:D-hexose-6-phosphate mutarotase
VEPAALDDRFGIPGVLRFERGEGGLTRAVATTGAATAEVYLHGAQVTGFEPVGSPPVLFISPHSAYTAGRAIRGGVPVIFPWFGPHPSDPRAPDHGLVRTREWSVDSVEANGGLLTIALALEASDATLAVWPHAFALLCRVTIGTALEVALTVENRSPEAFAVEEALHTYLHVGDVAAATVHGLEGVAYIDKAGGMARKRQGPGPVRLQALTDRVYLDTEGPCTVDDPVLGRRLRVDKRGSRTTVIWNPGPQVAQAMADLGPEAWRTMLCVETANAADNRVRIEPGQRHEMSARIAVAAGGPGGGPSTPVTGGSPSAP